MLYLPFFKFTLHIWFHLGAMFLLIYLSVFYIYGFLYWFNSSLLFCFLFFFLSSSFCEFECAFLWVFLLSFAFTIFLGVMSTCYFLVWLIFFLFLYLLCQIVHGALVLQQWVGPELLRWETWIQDVGPQENSWPHGILTRESSSKGLIPTLRPGYTQQPESSSAGHLMPNN